MSIPHILLVPYPAQGHVMPMMELAQIIAEHGYKVTFVNTEVNHKRIMNAMPNSDGFSDAIHLVSVQDGLEAWDDRKDLGKSSPAILRVMSAKPHDIIENVNKEAGDTPITCLIADIGVAWALEIAVKFSLKPVIFWPPAAASLAVISSLPKMLEDGILESDGNFAKHQMIHLSPTCLPSTLQHFYGSVSAT